MKLKRILMSSLMVAGIAALASCGGNNATSTNTNKPSNPTQSGNPTGAEKEANGVDIVEVVENMDMETIAKSYVGKYIYVESETTKYKDGKADYVSNTDKTEVGVGEKVVVNNISSKYSKSTGEVVETKSYHQLTEDAAVTLYNPSSTNGYYSESAIPDYLETIVNTDYTKFDFSQFNTYKNMMVALLKDSGSLTTLIPAATPTTINYDEVAKTIAPLVKVGIVKVTKTDAGFTLALDVEGFNAYLEANPQVTTLRDLLDELFDEVNVDKVLRTIDNVVSYIPYPVAKSIPGMIKMYSSMPIAMLGSILSSIQVNYEYTSTLQTINITLPMEMLESMSGASYNQDRAIEGPVLEPRVSYGGTEEPAGGTVEVEEPTMVNFTLMSSAKSTSFVVKSVEGEDEFKLADGVFTNDKDEVTALVKSYVPDTKTGTIIETEVLNLNVKSNGQFSIATPVCSLTYDGAKLDGEFTSTSYDSSVNKTVANIIKLAGEKTTNKATLNISAYEQYDGENNQTLKGQVKLEATKGNNELDFSVVVSPTDEFGQTTSASIICKYNADVLTVNVAVESTQKKEYKEWDYENQVYVTRGTYNKNSNGTAEFAFNTKTGALSLNTLVKNNDVEVLKLAFDSSKGGTYKGVTLEQDWDATNNVMKYSVYEETTATIEVNNAQKINTEVSNAISTYVANAMKEFAKESHYLSVEFENNITINNLQTNYSEDNKSVTISGNNISGFNFKAKDKEGKTVVLEANTMYEVAYTANLTDPSYYSSSTVRFDTVAKINGSIVIRLAEDEYLAYINGSWALYEDSNCTTIKEKNESNLDLDSVKTAALYYFGVYATELADAKIVDNSVA